MFSPSVDSDVQPTLKPTTAYSRWGPQISLLVRCTRPRALDHTQGTDQQVLRVRNRHCPIGTLTEPRLL